MTPHLTDGAYMVIPDLQVPLHDQDAVAAWKYYQWRQYWAAEEANHRSAPGWRDFDALADELFVLFRRDLFLP